jgi:hypothetical protein
MGILYCGAFPHLNSISEWRSNMKQLDMSNFEVDPGENVTIKVTAIKVGEFVTLAVDGKPIDPQLKAPKTFSITASTVPGTRHAGRLGFTFPPDAPTDAGYRYTVSGSQGGSFEGLEVTPNESTPTRTVNLIVRGGNS